MEELVFFIYRVLSVLLIETSYVPDEYWQSLEVAHKMVFGYGYMTWEWKYGLRSYLYPGMFAILYKVLQVLELDTTPVLITAPRVLEAGITAVADIYFYRLCERFGCKSFWTKLIVFTNGFWFYCGSRTIVNMFESSLTMISLYYYPWIILRPGFLQHEKYVAEEWLSIRRQSIIYIAIAALNCVVRPTAITIWAPLIGLHLWKVYPAKAKSLIFQIILPVGFVVGALALSIDCALYGKFVFTPYNFFMFNIFSGLSSFYGSHPFYWYITQGIPVVLGVHTLLFIGAVYNVLRGASRVFKNYLERSQEVLLAIIIINISIFSMISHKEFRFLLPLLPMMEIMIVWYVSNSKKLNSYETPSAIATFILFVSFILYSVPIACFHQRGTLPVMEYLSEEAAKNPNNSSYLFLTPCHATPLYSHLHVNVPVRFLTCEPPLTPNSVDESDQFFANPRQWLEKNWNDLDPPTHIVFFDTVVHSVKEFLHDKGFFIARNITHTIFRGMSSGNQILVYGRKGPKQSMTPTKEQCKIWPRGSILVDREVCHPKQ